MFFPSCPAAQFIIGIIKTTIATDLFSNDDNDVLLLNNQTDLLWSCNDYLSSTIVNVLQ